MAYRWTWIWRTTVRQIFAYDGQYAWSQSDAYQVFVICIRRILHMTDQFSWSHWVYHIQVHLYKQQVWHDMRVSWIYKVYSYHLVSWLIWQVIRPELVWTGRVFHYQWKAMQCLQTINTAVHYKDCRVSIWELSYMPWNWFLMNCVTVDQSQEGGTSICTVLWFLRRIWYTRTTRIIWRSVYMEVRLYASKLIFDELYGVQLVPGGKD